MRMVVFLLLALTSFLKAKECFVEVNNLEVKEQPTAQSKVITKLDAGSVVKITGEKDGWYEVGIGFIKKDYCSIISKSTKKQIKEALKTGSVLPKNQLPAGLNPQIVDSLYSVAFISLTDVSRISCPVKIKWFTYSKEKEIQIQKAGKNLLVKISPKVLKENEIVKKIERSTYPRELLVECGGQIFTLILLPKEVPTQTIILKPKFENKKKAIEFETSTPYEKTIKKLIKKAYKEEAIDGYEIQYINKPYKKFKRLYMDLYQIYKGAYYNIYVYKLKARKNIDLHEKLFIPFVKNPVAISLTKLHLNAGEEARLFVVSKQEDN